MKMLTRNDERHVDTRPLATSATRHHGADRAARLAAGWTTAFILVHVYWAMGGRVGFGDQTDPIPDTTSSLLGWIFTVAVAAMFLAGVVVPLAVVRPWGKRVPRWLLRASLWFGAAVLLARGGGGLLDGLLRAVGFEHGLTGLSYEDTLGSAHPSRSTVWSSAGIDATFLLGGLLFARSAHLAYPGRPAHREAPR